MTTLLALIPLALFLGLLIAGRYPGERRFARRLRRFAGRFARRQRTPQPACLLPAAPRARARGRAPPAAAQ